MKNFLSVPAGVLQPSSMKFPVIFQNEALLALEIPEKINTKKYVDFLKDHVSSAQHQMVGLRSPILLVDGLDEATGICLLAKDQESAHFYRNLYGSDKLTLCLDFLTIPSGLEAGTALTCDLPLARHFVTGKTIVSHRTGKKTMTQFQCLESFPKVEHWQAKTHFLRRGQLEAHAKEVGLSIFHSDDPSCVDPTRKFLKKNIQQEHWSKQYCPVILSKIEINLEDETLTIAAELPKKFLTLKRLLSA